MSIHLKEYFREPAILFWSFVFPIAMALVLGIAFANKREVVRTVAILDNSRGSKTQLDELFSKLTAEHTEKIKIEENLVTTSEKEIGTITKFKFIFSTRDQALQALKRGKITLFIEEGDKGDLRYYFDPQNPEAELTYLLLEKILQVENLNVNKTEIVPLTAKGDRYIDFLIPGLLALGVMNACMWGICWALIELRIKKLLRRMLATPMRKSVFLISYFFPRVILTGLEALAVYVFAFWIFGVEIQGNPLALLMVFIAGIIAFMGIAIFSSTRAKNTEVGTGIVNAVTLPMMILSGVFFSYHNFPDWSIPVIQKLPLTMLADSMRSIFIEGAGFHEVALPSFLLVLTGVFFFFLGLRIYKWH